MVFLVRFFSSLLAVVVVGAVWPARLAAAANFDANNSSPTTIGRSPRR